MFSMLKISELIAALEKVSLFSSRKINAICVEFGNKINLKFRSFHRKMKSYLKYSRTRS